MTDYRWYLDNIELGERVADALYWSKLCALNGTPLAYMGVF